MRASWFILVADHWSALLISPRRRLSQASIGARTAVGVVIDSWGEVDLIRAKLEDLTQLPHLRDLRLAPATLPEIDRLRLYTDRERQLKLRPASLQPQFANGPHR